MNTKTLLPLLLLLIALPGCFPHLDDTEEVITWDHYATGFLVKPIVYASLDGRTGLLVLQNTLTLTEDDNCLTILKEEQRPRVEKYARQFGDKLAEPVTYRGLVRNGGAVIPLNLYYIDPVAKVTLRSNLAWDAAHPAGSDLSDLFAGFTACADRYAREGKPYPEQKRPEEYPTHNEAYRRLFEQYLGIEDHTRELLCGRLSDLDLSDKDYVGMGTALMVLATDSEVLRKPQELVIELTLHSGEKTAVKLQIKQQM